MSKIKGTTIWAAGALAAVLALAIPGPASATEFAFTGVVQDLGTLGNPGSFNFGDGSAIGDNDASHFDYIFSFTLTDTAKLDAGISAGSAELHAMFYNADPSGQSLFTHGDPGIVDGVDNDNLIDIGSSASNQVAGASGGNATAVALASLASGSYYLRIFGVPTGSISHFTGQLVASALTATTPIPAALPLFLSGIGVLAVAARRRKVATA